MEASEAIGPQVQEISEPITPPRPSDQYLRSRGLPGIKGKIGQIALTLLLAKGGISLAGDLAQATRISHFPQATSATDSSNESQGSVEARYGVRFYSMRDAYSILGLPYDEQNPKEVGPRPPVRWDEKQISLMNDLLSYLPNSFIQSDKNSLSLFLADWWGTDLDAGGAYFGKGFVGLLADEVNPVDREGTFSILVHEMTHRFDLDHPDFRRKVIETLGDKKFLSSKYLTDKGTWNKLVQENPDINGALSTLGSFTGKPDDDAEGIAGFSQLEVKGYDRFMRALGPVLDGIGQYPVSPSDYSSFPKTQALYDLYKNEVFGGKDFTQLQELIKYGPKFESDNKAALSAKENLKEEFDINIIDSQSTPLSHDEIIKLDKLLRIFPKYFYATLDGQKFSVIFSDTETEQRNDGQIVFLSRKDLSYQPDMWTVVPAAISVAHQLILRADELKGHEPSQKIIQLLGGNQFLNSPENIFPNLFVFHPI